jgi:hypothetical protein
MAQTKDALFIPRIKVQCQSCINPFRVIHTHKRKKKKEKRKKKKRKKKSLPSDQSLTLYLPTPACFFPALSSFQTKPPSTNISPSL